MSVFSRLLGRPPAAPPASSTAARPFPAAAPPEPPDQNDAGLAAFFAEDHRACDRLWAEAEGAADLEGAVDAWRRFDAALRRHLGWEENVLFPAFEDASGHHGFGPTVIMRGEHGQMRAVLDEMERCAAAGDRKGLNEQGDTLMMLIQQHNAKEEGMLYPMTEQVLGDRGWQAIAPRFV